MPAACYIKVANQRPVEILRCPPRPPAPPTPQPPILLRENVGQHRGADAQPRRGAQQPVGRPDRGAARGADANRRRQERARRGDRGQRPGLLRRPRSEGTDRAAQRCRPRPRLFRAHHERLQRDDAGDRASAAAGDRRRAGRRDRGRLPAGRELRSRGRLGDGGLRHARRQYRPVLLDADGGAVAQRPAQARDGNAAHRRADRGRRRARDIGLVNRVVPPAPNATPRSRWRSKSRRNPPTRSSSARKRSTARPK